MSSVDPIRVRDHFLAAAELPKAARRSYLDENCGSHAELRAAIERLLAAHDDPLSLVNPVTVDYAPDLGLMNTSTTNTFDDAEESGGVLIGRYKLVERIGEGGMGEVWSARQTEPVKRMVAVKLIKPGMDSKAVLARFEAERQALALMDHPNIARVLDAGTTSDGRPFFAMELVKGIPIAKYCDDRKLSTRRRLELFVSVCQAIQHAHQKGIIHRDIKPSNVLVAQYDDRAVPKVIDFGVAKATGQALTEMTLNTGFGNIVGTLEYMSPEQATFNNLDIDTRSDVYALGVLLYELLTGGPPFKKRDLEKGGILEILRVVKEVDPPRPSTRISTAAALPTVAANRSTNPARLKVLLRNELDWIAMKALEKDRSRRYQTANGMAADIERHLAGEEVMAVPPSIGYRLRKFIGKYRVAATAGILVVLSLFCGAIVATIGLVRADLARDSEAEQRLRAEEQAAIAEEKTRISMVAEKRANEEAARAWASAQAESAAVVKSQRLLGLTYLKDAAQLLDNGNIEMGLLRITHAMSIASQVPEIQDIARTQLVLHEKSELTCLKHFLKVPHSERSIPIVFSPNRHMLFSVVDGKSAQVWDVESGKPISPLLEYPVAIASAAFSPDGERILTGCNDGSLWWWNSGGDRPVLKKKLPGSVRAIAFMQKGIRVSTINSEGIGQVWDVESEKAQPLLSMANNRIICASFSPTGDRVAFGTADSYLRVYNLENGQSCSSLHKDEVVAVAFSPDGNTIASGSRDQFAKLWNAATGKIICSALHSDSVFSLAFSRDGKYLLSGCRDNLSRIWKIEAGKANLISKNMHTDLVETVAFSPSGNRTLTACRDGTCRVHEVSSSIAAISPTASLDPQIESLAFSFDGRRRVVGYKNGSVGIWDGESRKPIAISNAHRGSVKAVAFSQDCRYIVTGGEDKLAHVWSAKTGASMSAQFTQEGRVLSATFSPDGSLVAVGNSLGSVLVWKSTSKNGYEPFKKFVHGGAIECVAFSPNGQRIAIGSTNRLVRIWEVDSVKEVSPPLRHSEAVESVALSSPDGRLVLTGCKNGTVSVFEIGSPDPISQGPIHSKEVKSVAFSEDSRWAITGSEDGVASMWDVKSGIPLSPRIQHAIPIANATFSPDCKRVVLGSIDGPPQMVDISLGEKRDRDVADLVRLAQLKSSHRIDESGRAVPLSSAESNALWLHLRTKYPNEFSISK